MYEVEEVRTSENENELEDKSDGESEKGNEAEEKLESMEDANIPRSRYG